MRERRAEGALRRSLILQTSYKTRRTSFIVRLPVELTILYNNYNLLKKKEFLMKKLSSFLTLILVVCMLLTALSACSLFEPEEKTFSKAGMSITLTEEFFEKDIVTQTAYYVSEDVIVTALKESHDLLKGKSVKEYAELVCEANSFDKASVKVNGSYAEFEFESEANGKDFYYYARCFKNGDDYWLFQFGCEIDDKDDLKENFYKWASSVKFDA